MPSTVELVPALSDNYIYLIHTDSGSLVVDPAEAEPVQRALGSRPLLAVLNTHHHSDHIAGNDALRSKDIPLIAPVDARIPHVDRTVAEGDTVDLAGLSFQVFEVPGHTSTHIAFYEAQRGWLFSGDSLFAGGCGRLFEGTPEQMWNSLGKLRQLPDATQVFCGHEYTESNLHFALSLEPDHQALRERFQNVQRLRSAGKPTIPSTLGEEKKTNPFLRADDPSLKKALDMESASDVEVFARVRQLKDDF